MVEYDGKSECPVCGCNLVKQKKGVFNTLLGKAQTETFVCGGESGFKPRTGCGYKKIQSVDTDPQLNTEREKMDFKI